jgi:hypothetical protein
LKRISAPKASSLFAVAITITLASGCARPVLQSLGAGLEVTAPASPAGLRSNAQADPSVYFLGQGILKTAQTAALPARFDSPIRIASSHRSGVRPGCRD